MMTLGQYLAYAVVQIPREHQATLKIALDRRHKPTAARADEDAAATAS